MSKLAEFFKKTLAENQAGYKRIEKEKEEEKRRLKIEEREKELERQFAKFCKKFEIQLQDDYREHRIALQEYKNKLAERESSLNQTEIEIEMRLQEITNKEEELSKREKELSEKEEGYEKKIKESIKKYSDKKKKELFTEAMREREKTRADLEALQEYETALRRTELTIIDWIKRVDRKEKEAFKEIQQDVMDFQSCDISPPKDGHEFECRFAAALKRCGFSNVEVTQESGDFGADVLAEKDGVKYVIQCKYYTSSVGVKAVQQVFASKIHYSAHVAVVATNSVFTKSAKVLAKETGVLLWNGLKVQEMLG